jgi:hypothetical protein
MNVRDVLISKIAIRPYYAVIVNNEVYADSGNYFIFDSKQDAEDAIEFLRKDYELEDAAEVKEITFSAEKTRSNIFCYIIVGKKEDKEEYFIFNDECCGVDPICVYNTDIDDSYIRDEVNNDIGIITHAYIIVK